MGIFITPLWSEYIVSADQGGIFMGSMSIVGVGFVKIPPYY